MNYTTKELNKYGVQISDADIAERLIQLGHEVEETIDLNIEGLVIGEVVSCIKHPDADKLSITKVNIGTETVQIVCGAPNVRAGLKVIVATEGTVLESIGLTIKPVKLKGEESNGMLCSLAELGLGNNVLLDSDIDGICELPADSPVGQSACEFLGLDDRVMDVSLTADRGDCQNYAGAVNDLKALINTTAEYSDYKFEADLWASEEVTYSGTKQVPVHVEAEKTIYYSTQLVEGVEVKPSAIRDRVFLMKNGVKSINNIVDNSNYGLLTFGLPSHAFDADKIVGDVYVKKTDKEEKFVGLDGNEYTLAPDTLVITDSEKIICVAGVMGSEDTKVTDETTNILFELAIFDPTEVRLAAKNLGFKTDASIRYEKGVNYDAINVTRNSIISNFGGTANAPFIGCDNATPKHQITLNYETIERVLGITIEVETVKAILAELQFEVVAEDETSATYSVPKHRHDVDFENDLVEEVIRVYGIDRIETSETLPSFNKVTRVHDDRELIVERKLEQSFLATGLSQVVSYSLTSEDKIELFCEEIKPVVKLAYPISNERSVYRQSLVNSLIETAKYNLDRQQNYSSIFEIADAYHIEGEEIIRRRLLSAVLTGKFEDSYLGAKRNFDFYDLKAMLEAGLNDLVGELTFVASDLQMAELNPYATAEVFAGETRLGYIGTVHPSFVKKAKYPIFCFELDFETIVSLAQLTSDYKPVTNAPKMERDFTITVASDVTYGQLLQVIEGVDYIANVKLIDIYDGEHIEAGFKACTINIEFAKDGQTLTTELIDAEADKLVSNVERLGYKF